jgi:protein SCO1/2
MIGTLLICLFSAVRAEEPKAAGEKYFTDTELVNQDGEGVRFYSDVLKGKTVVINAFYTTNTGADPVISRNLEKIQEGLGARVGKDVFLVSITVDPVTDTPGRLKAYAEKFNAKPGWVFLTGQRENVQTVLKKLGLYVADKDGHPNLLLIGNDTTGLWKKAFGLANPNQLLKIVESVMNDK